MSITKKTISALERVFSAEIEGRLPFQSKAKIYSDLCDEGLLQPWERTLHRGDWPPITISGYALTHAGRITYCMSCG